MKFRSLLYRISFPYRKIRKAIRQKRRNIPLNSTDVVLVSYPRSGISWVSFLLANLIKPDSEQIDFFTVHDYIPEIGRHNRTIKKLDFPCIIKSHETYREQYPRVIYLVRDGRDVLLSYYYYRINELPEETTFSDFLRRNDHYPSTWWDHVSSWLDNKYHHPDFLVVRYEDLARDTKSELQRMVDFIGLDVTNHELDLSINQSRFKKMKEIEKVKGRKYNLTKTDSFVRKGQSGNWQDEFSPEDQKFFSEMAGEVLERLGYTG